MTEAEWWKLTDPGSSLSRFPRPVSPRKDRLFAVGCCYHIWGYIADERSREAIRMAEKFADGEATAEELGTAHAAAGEAFHEAAESAEDQDSVDAAAAAEAASDPDETFGCLTSDLTMNASGYTVREANHALLLELLGPPFRPVTVNRAWLTATVTALAQAIYDERSLDRLPILADALEDAGCTSQDILNHCRGGRQHCRGCWALDLLLGKE